MAAPDRHVKEIAFILPSFAGGGAERVALHLANSVDRRHYRPVFLVFEDTGPLRAALAPEITVINLGQPRLRQAIWPLRQILQERTPAYVLSSMAYVNLAILALCRRVLPQSRIIVREANTTDATLQAFPSAALGRLLYRRYYPKADAIICPSQAIADDLAEKFSIPRSLLKVQHNPVDVDRLRAMVTVQPEVGRPPRFVAAGRLTAQKGFERLIDVFAQMSSSAHLDILGAGPLEETLKDQIGRLGLSARVQLRGFTDNPWNHYAGADCFLLSSHWEGMPNAALEALACGTPVISTPEAGGIAEVAAVATSEAVRIAPMGSGFLSHMNAVVSDESPRPRASLLPAEFNKFTVSANFNTLLESLQTGGYSDR